MVVQRAVLSFARGCELKYASHLDLMRLWARALNRAEVPVAFSQGFSPHPKIALAAPLAVGVTSESELLDLQLERRVSLQFLAQELTKVLPKGLSILGAQEIPIPAPSLQARILFASYRVGVKMTMSRKEFEDSIDRILKAQSLPRIRIREGRTRTYDLRPLIRELRLEQLENSQAVLSMTLRQDNTRAGRPEEVTAELGLANPPLSIHRTGLEFKE